MPLLMFTNNLAEAGGKINLFLNYQKRLSVYTGGRF